MNRGRRGGAPPRPTAPEGGNKLGPRPQPHQPWETLAPCKRKVAMCPSAPPSSPTPLGLVQGRDGFSPGSGHSAWGDISPSPSPPAFEQTQGEASGWGGLKIPPAWLLLSGPRWGTGSVGHSAVWGGGFPGWPEHTAGSDTASPLGSESERFGLCAREPRVGDRCQLSPVPPHTFPHAISQPGAGHQPPARGHRKGAGEKRFSGVCWLS